MSRFRMFSLFVVLALAATVGGWIIVEVSGATGSNIRSYAVSRLTTPVSHASPTGGAVAGNALASATTAPALELLRPSATGAALLTATAQPTPTGAPSPPRTTPTAASAFIEYTVEKGDVLYTIAKRHRVTIQDILAINEIPRPDSLNVGDVIHIPTK
jgi:LysM repeat protein